MRTFIAIPCPVNLTKKITRVQNHIGGMGGIKLVDPRNIHLTLKFFGDVDEKRSTELAKKLECIEEIEPFKMSLKGVGVFPSLDYIRVIWMGVDEGEKNIIDLYKKILDALDLKEDKKFHPHLTIGRVKFLDDKEKLLKFLNENREKVFDRFDVRQIELMESKLTPKGPVYSVLKEFKLG